MCQHPRLILRYNAKNSENSEKFKGNKEHPKFYYPENNSILKFVLYPFRHSLGVHVHTCTYTDAQKFILQKVELYKFLH